MRKRLVQALSGLIGAGVAVAINVTMAAADKLSRFKAWSPRQLGAVVDNRAQAYDWSGFYTGLQVGYGWGDTRADAYWGSMVGAWEDFHYSNRGAIGGFHAGYSIDADDIVFGLEADVEATGITGTGSNASAIHAADIDWSTSLRARVGFKVADRSLLYLTGGIAYANVSTTQHTFTGLSPYSSHDEWKAGWTAGAGIEHAFTPRITARLEYRYLDLGKISYFDEALAMKATHDLNNHSVRAGFSVRF